MIEIEGVQYEPAENSTAKNIVLYALEDFLDKAGVETSNDRTDEEIIDLIGLADVIVEDLLKAGVVIPEDIKE